MAPKCKTGYPSFERDRIGEKPNFHHFPTNPERQVIWINAVPKHDLEVKNDTVLCSLHFTADSFQTERIDKREERGEELKSELLKPDAVPSIWPNCSWYLSKVTTP